MNVTYTLVLPLYFLLIIYPGSTAPSGPRPPNYRGLQSHSDTPHSVGLLWTSDRPDAKTSTLQQTTLTKDKHPYPGGIRTRNPSKRAAADSSIRPRGHWDRRTFCLDFQFFLQRKVSFLLSSRRLSPVLLLSLR